MTLSDAVVIVTGASRGIGRAIARRLGEAGARVGLVARDAAALELVARELDPMGASAVPIPVDLRAADAARRIVSSVHERFGRCDAAVCSAGVAHWGPLLKQDPELWREMLEVNLLAPLALAQALTALEEGPRHLIHVSSVAAIKPLCGNGMYAASKAALRVAGESLRQELAALGGSLRLTTLVPGLVETEMTHRLGDAEAQARVDELRRSFPFLEPDDVAQAVIWALEQPPHVAVNEIVLRSPRQPL